LDRRGEFRCIASSGFRARTALAAAIALALLAVASRSPDGTRGPDGKPQTVTVLYWDEPSFQEQYGVLLTAAHPEIEIRVAATAAIPYDDGGDYEAKLRRFIDEQKPDILTLSLEQYERYAAEGRLVQLEPYMIRDGLDAEGFIPGLIDLMRHLGAGDLYGLTPHFSSQAVFWNKDLFNRFHVDYPTDRMSWEELFGLAARFPNEGPDGKRVYGLDLGTANLHEIASDIGIARGLRVVNPSDGRVAVDSEAWVRVYEMALEAVRSGALYREEDEPEEDGEPGSFDSRDPFITGKAAMTIRWDDFLNDLRQAAADPDGAVRNWDIVTHPVDPANPEYSHAAQYGDIFAINEASVNRDAAWNVIRYIHGDDFARAVSKIRGWGFPVRKAPRRRRPEPGGLLHAEAGGQAVLRGVRPSSGPVLHGLPQHRHGGHASCHGGPDVGAGSARRPARPAAGGPGRSEGCRIGRDRRSVSDRREAQPSGCAFAVSWAYCACRRSA